MMRYDGAALRVLYIGGTGTISTSCVRLSVESGMSVFVLNRGNNSAARGLPEGVTWLTGDVTDDASLLGAIGDQCFDAVVNFLSYDPDDVHRMVEMFGARTRQYLHISSASIYVKPVQQSPITESTPIGPNPVLEYATAKWRAEQALQRARTEKGFPVTIIRPSHTYDDANPPVPGGWTVIDRIARGAEIPVHGDGTSLWTLTHAEDFAQGLVGLLGNSRTIGEVFNITGEVLGDIGHTGVFDTSKIRRFVPGFSPKLTFQRAALRMIQWRADHPDTTGSDQATDAVLDRIVEAYHAAREVFADRVPQPAGMDL